MATSARVNRVTYELLDDNLVRLERRVTSTKNFGNRLNNLKKFKWADEESKEVYNRLWNRRIKVKPITKFITFIILVGMYILIPYPLVRFLFYIIVVLSFIRVTAIGMEIKEGFDEMYEAYDNLLDLLKGDNKWVMINLKQRKDLVK